MQENSGQTIIVKPTDFLRLVGAVMNQLTDDRYNPTIKFFESEGTSIILAIDETRIFIRLDDDGFTVGRKNNQRGGRWEIDEDNIGLTADQAIPVAVAEMKQQIAADILAWVRAASASGSELSEALRKAREESSELETLDEHERD